MVAVALGILASATWGVADFIGGLQARRMAVLVVVFGSQLAGLALVVPVVLARGEPLPGGDFAVYAALSSIGGIVGLTSFYKALSIGAMGVVAPLSSLAAVIPVAVGVATGERPSAVQGIGLAVALAGVMLAAREGGDEAQRSSAISAGVGLALISAVGFGCFFLAIDRASDEDVLWAVCVNRTVSVSVLALVLLATRPKLGGVGPAQMGTLALVGVLDISANGLFAVAATEGLVSVVAVLSSLYPVVTVILARVVLKERLQAVQRIGAAAALAGVVLITAG
jgi:drug/metabolite transporter (DMT)-like permease